MSREPSISSLAIIRGSYTYMRGAIVPGLMGSFMFVLAAFITDYVQAHQVFGSFSPLFSVVLFAGIGVVWFAMALRLGLGLKGEGFGLQLGRDELMLFVSVLGFLFVLAIVGILIGFLVFLLVMMIAAIGGGALTGADVAGADVAGASIYETPEAFRTFLASTSQGQVIGTLSVGITLAGLLFMIWLIVRLLPFAAGAVQEKRFVVLQAMSWTRYQDRALFGAGLATLGVAAAVIVASRIVLGALPLTGPVAIIATHLVACMSLLIVVGFICEVYLRTAEKAGSD